MAGFGMTVPGLVLRMRRAGGSSPPTAGPLSTRGFQHGIPGPTPLRAFWFVRMTGDAEVPTLWSRKSSAPVDIFSADALSIPFASSVASGL